MLPQIFERAKASGLLSPWVVGPAVFILWLGILLTARKWILAATRRYIAVRTSWVWAETLADALSPALAVAIVAGGFGLLDRIVPLSRGSDRLFVIIVTGLLILALIIFSDRICRHLLARLAAKSPAVQGALGLVQGGVRGLIIGLGALVFLDSLGIPITPLLASLGIGTLAVALALQDTLANLFAGIYMIAEKPVEAGHFIRLEGGEQGYVTKVGWRSTHLRMLTDTVVVVPNAKLAGSVITNFSLPKDELTVTIDVGVDYESDLQQVEQVTLEVALEVIAHTQGAIPSFEPRMRYHTFADSSINFTVWLGARDFVSGMAIRHEFIKLLHNRYQTAGISMPFPTRTLELRTDTISKLRQIIFQQENGRKDATS
jgi:small-conductance mechanosensitive channel